MSKNKNGEAVASLSEDEPRKKKAGKNEAPKKKRGIGRWFKELFSELKKVTWPTFMTVLKQTGVVLLVTAIFLVVLMGMDALLGWLYDLLKTAISTESFVSGGFFSVLSNISGLGGRLL